MALWTLRAARRCSRSGGVTRRLHFSPEPMKKCTQRATTKESQDILGDLLLLLLPLPQPLLLLPLMLLLQVRLLPLLLLQLPLRLLL